MCDGGVVFRVTAEYIYIMLETDDRDGEMWQNASADLAFEHRNEYEQHICSGFLIITCRTVGKPVRVSISSQLPGRITNTSNTNSY